MANMLTTLLSTKELQFRYEKKFSTTYVDEPTIITLIKHHPALFKKHYVTRQVNNIYFDTPTLGSFKDNIEGNNRRIKARIRWYGNFFREIQKPILELKIKQGMLGTKVSYPLKSFTLAKGFSFKQLQKELFKQSNLPAWLVEKLKHLQPTLFNSYQRSYYQSQNKHYRLTLDTNVLYSKAKQTSNTFHVTKHPEEQLILELKYAPEHDENASFITQHFPFRVDKHSKYALGVTLLT